MYVYIVWHHRRYLDRKTKQQSWWSVRSMSLNSSIAVSYRWCSYHTWDNAAAEFYKCTHQYFTICDHLLNMRITPFNKTVDILHMGWRTTCNWQSAM